MPKAKLTPAERKARRNQLIGWGSILGVLVYQAVMSINFPEAYKLLHDKEHVFSFTYGAPPKTIFLGTWDNLLAIFGVLRLSWEYIAKGFSMAGKLAGLLASKVAGRFGPPGK